MDALSVRPGQTDGKERLIPDTGHLLLGPSVARSLGHAIHPTPSTHYPGPTFPATRVRGPAATLGALSGGEVTLRGYLRRGVWWVCITYPVSRALHTAELGLLTWEGRRDRRAQWLMPPFQKAITVPYCQQ